MSFQPVITESRQCVGPAGFYEATVYEHLAPGHRCYGQIKAGNSTTDAQVTPFQCQDELLKRGIIQ